MLLSIEVPPGFDLWQTPPPSASGPGTFTDVALPAGFFGPGSEPFHGQICFQGESTGPLGNSSGSTSLQFAAPLQSQTGQLDLIPLPLGPLGSPDLAPTDTIVRRLDSASLPGAGDSATVRIELVSLSLVSCQPIVVRYSGTLFTAQFDVRVDLSPVTTQPQGSMSMTRTSVDGGTFSATLPIVPRFTFVNLNPAGAQPLGQPEFPQIFVGQGTFQVPLRLTENFFESNSVLPEHGQFFSPEGDRVMFTPTLTEDELYMVFASVPPPPPDFGTTVVETSTASVGLELSNDGGATHFDVFASAQARVQVTHTRDDGGTRYYDTEMLQLNISGGTLPPGKMIRESPTRASLGRATIRELPGGGFMIASFFDIFTELSVNGGETWLPGNAPVQVDLTRSVESLFPDKPVPPPSGQYVTTAATRTMYDNGLIVKDMVHQSFAGMSFAPPPVMFTGQPVDFDGHEAQFLASTDGGRTFVQEAASSHFRVFFDYNRDLGHTQVYDTELLQLDISGGSLPPGWMIRESPTRPSLGRTTVRQVPDGYMISSFFDVFTELSTNGGETWSPSVGSQHLEVVPLPGSIHGFKFEDRDGDGKYEPRMEMHVPNFGDPADLQPGVIIQWLVDTTEPIVISGGLPAGSVIGGNGTLVMSSHPPISLKGGTLGGSITHFAAPMTFELKGTGGLVGFQHALTLDLNFEVHSSQALVVSDDVINMVFAAPRVTGQIIGDTDFDLLRITAGSDFGLATSGHSTLARLPSGDWAADSFFDIEYRIDFVGATGGPLAGMAGSSTGTFRLESPHPEHGDRPLGGVEFAVTGTDVMGHEVSRTETTNDRGEFWFNDLFPGNYSVHENPAGSVPTRPPEANFVVHSGEEFVALPGQAMLSPNDPRHEVVVGDKLNFGNTFVGSIHGYKFEDLDGDGIADPGEPPMANVVIAIQGDLDGDGKAEIVTQTTNNDGEFAFPNLRPGPYSVSERPPAGSVPTTPPTVSVLVHSGEELVAIASQARLGPNAPQHEVVLGDRLKFGNTFPGSIHGYKFEDLDGDGVEDPGEPRLAGVPIELASGFDAAGSPIIVANDVTDAAGEYSFTGLLPGSYAVIERPPAGSTPTTPPVVGPFTLSSRQELVAYGREAKLDPGDPRVEVIVGPRLVFGNAFLGSIHGLKFEDLDGDGVYDSGEPGMAGVPIHLAGNDGKGKPFDRFTTTDANGEFAFENLAPGSGVLIETPSPGSIPTTLGPATILVWRSREELVALSGQAKLPPGDPRREVLQPRDLLIGNAFTGSIHGFKFLDRDDDGRYEPLLPVVVADGTQDGRQNGAVHNSDYDFNDSSSRLLELKEILVTSISELSAPERLAAGPDSSFFAYGTLKYGVSGVGPLAGYHRDFAIPVSFETRVGPSTTTGGVQSYDTEMLQLSAHLPPGDPDFDLLRITAGSAFGLPSPGHTTLTQQPGGTWAVDSFFDITYRIDFVGAPGGPLAGQSGSGTASTHGATPTAASGDKPLGGVQITVSGSDGLGNPVSRTTTTDEHGEFRITGLDPGHYTASENPPAGTFPTTRPEVPIDLHSREEFVAFAGQAMLGPNDPQHEVVVGPRLMFGNTRRGSIHGFKFEDLDGDGVFDANEPGLGGVTMTLTGTTAAGQPMSQNITTTAGGRFSFDGLVPGVYKVREAALTGSLATTPTVLGPFRVRSGQELVAFAGQADLPQGDPRSEFVLGSKLMIGNMFPGSIHGFKFEDVDGDGRFDGPAPCITPDQGIGTIVLAQTNCVYSAAGTESIPFAGSVLAGGDIIAVPTLSNFANVQILFDGTSGRQERFAAALKLELRKAGGDPQEHLRYLQIPLQDVLVSGFSVAGHGDPVPTESLSLNFTKIEFALAPGDPDFDLLRITAGSDFGLPSSGHTTLARMTNGNWSVDSFFDITYRIDFVGTPSGLLAGRPGSTTGTIRMQAGTPGPHDDVPSGGVPITLTGTDSQGHSVNQSGTTNSHGEFWFQNLLPGTYFVTETAPVGSVPTTPVQIGPVTLRSRQELVALPGEAMLPRNDPRTEIVVGPQLMFGNTYRGSIHGYKFEDLDFNGNDNGGADPRLAGVTIKLAGTDGLGNPVSQTATTNTTGQYAFTGLLPGNYTVTETPPVGTAPTTPTSANVTVLSRQELVAFQGQALLQPGAPQREVVLGNSLKFGNHYQQLDYGDAPDPTFPTRSATNGARHIVLPGFFLGARVDTEADGQPNATASGDNQVGVPNDEDGVKLPATLNAGRRVNATVTVSQPGKLDAWIDFNHDGDWSDAGEQIFVGQSVNAGRNTLAFTVPNTAVASQQSFARFRLSKAGGLSFTGLAPDGEVEDYAFRISPARGAVAGVVGRNGVRSMVAARGGQPETTAIVDRLLSAGLNAAANVGGEPSTSVAVSFRMAALRDTSRLDELLDHDGSIFNGLILENLMLHGLQSLRG